MLSDCCVASLLSDCSKVRCDSEVPPQKDKNNIAVKDSIKAQIIIENKINENTKIAKEITNKKFTRAEMDVFAKNNGLEVQSTTLTSLKGNNTFSTGVIKRIFETDNKSINLITDNMLKDNFIIYVKDTKLTKTRKDVCLN